MKNQRDIQAESFVKLRKYRGHIKRGVALLCAFVMLFTMNSLKRSADTLERIPTCGFDYEHRHSESCYDAAGSLICGLHEHTDACYQERPHTEPAVEIALAEDPVAQVEVDLVGEDEVLLGEDAQEAVVDEAMAVEALPIA